MIKKLYCGGGFNFTQENWNSKLCEDWRCRLVLNGNTLIFTREPEFPFPIKNNLFYGGPYYFEKSEKEVSNFGESVVECEKRLIDESTYCLFVLNRNDILGTVAELVYAAMIGKEIHIVYSYNGNDKETESKYHNPAWYAITLANILSNKVNVYKATSNKEIEDNITAIIKSL